MYKFIKEANRMKYDHFMVRHPSRAATKTGIAMKDMGEHIIRGSLKDTIPKEKEVGRVVKQKELDERRKQQLRRVVKRKELDERRKQQLRRVVKQKELDERQKQQLGRVVKQKEVNAQRNQLHV